MDGVAYTWDANGNLHNDGSRTDAYNHANRLISGSGPSLAASYAYRCNGLSIGNGCESDRVSQTVNGVTINYVLDQATGLTQVLSDGTNTYLYGNGRIGQFTASDSAYFLTDALGSVRQLTDGAGVITVTKSYEPYGEVLSSTGGGASIYGFDGEQFDPATGLIYLRARYYSGGRFLTRDTWLGDDRTPMSYNAWLFGYSNPIGLIDPAGTTPYRLPLATFDDERENPTINLWQSADMLQIHHDLWDVARAYAKAYNQELTRLWNEECAGPGDPRPFFMKPLDAFYKIHRGPINIVRVGEESGVYGASESPSRIIIYTTTTPEDLSTHPRFIVHEVGHSFENAIADTIGRRPVWYNGGWMIQGNKWGRQNLPEELYNTRGNGVDTHGGFAGRFMEWQFSRDLGGLNAAQNTDGRGEIFADMFVGWVYNKWEEVGGTHYLTPLGSKRKNYMDSQMAGWVYGIIQVRTGKIAVPNIEDGRVVYRYQR